MNSILLAVYGHYDSRGGTTAIPVKDTSNAELQRADKEYNKCFYWEEDLKNYRDDPTGWAWDPTAPGSSPAENDFLYFARLWYQGELPDGDLEESGYVLREDDADNGLRNLEFVAFIKGDKYEDQLEEAGPAPEWPGINPDPQVQKVYMEYHDRVEAIRDRTRLAALKRAQVVVGPTAEIGDWNDDAFGFIIGTGMEV